MDDDAPPVEGLPRTDLAALLALDEVAEDLFRAPGRPSVYPRTFGGAVLAQALLAAGSTVAADRGVHSLHAYFLRPGDPTIPADFRVERLRDGGTFTTRRVTGTQAGRETLTLTASFQIAEDGWEHQLPVLVAPDLDTASLDHAVWFHRPVRVDEWLFYEQESSWSAGGRGLCSGRVFDREGRLVLTVAQEGMVRRRRMP